MKYVTLIILTICSINIYGQENDSNNDFLNRFTLRKSFGSKNDRAEPALITYTNPKSKAESWLLNSAIGFDVIPKTKKNITLNPYLEYHKNTLVEKEQNNWQTGLAFEWQTQDINIKNNWSPIFISSIKYNEDNIKNISSFQSNLYFTPLFKGKGLRCKYFWLPNNITNCKKAFQFIYSPYLGFESENRIKTEADSTKGNIYRGYFRITSDIILFPLNKKLKDKFEFNFDWQYRFNFEENIEVLDKTQHKYFKASFNYVFFNSEEGKSAKIGVDYINGENPSKNFEEQSFYSVTLKIKL